MQALVTATCLPTRRDELEKIGSEILNTFHGAFNTGNALAWAQQLNYPHVRLAGGKVQVWNTPEEYARDNDVTPMREKLNWGWTQFNWFKMVQGDEEKMHFVVETSRYTPTCKKIMTFDSFYVITKQEGRWGVQFRSSYVGIFSTNSAF